MKHSASESEHIGPTAEPNAAVPATDSKSFTAYEFVMLLSSVFVLFLFAFLFVSSGTSTSFSSVAEALDRIEDLESVGDEEAATAAEEWIVSRGNTAKLALQDEIETCEARIQDRLDRHIHEFRSGIAAHTRAGLRHSGDSFYARVKNDQHRDALLNRQLLCTHLLGRIAAD